jgi:uncharacterized protein (UPF0210 family)
MIDPLEIQETLRMIQLEHLDIRTITMGISLKDCADGDSARARDRIFRKITSLAATLVRVGQESARV